MSKLILDFEETEQGWRIIFDLSYKLECLYERKYKSTGKWRTKDAKKARILLKKIRMRRYYIANKIGIRKMDLQKYFSEDCKELKQALNTN